MQFTVSVGELLCIFFKLFENRFPIVMDMLDITISSSVIVHQVDSDVVALLDVGEEVVGRMDRVVFHLEVGECLDV